FEHRAGRDGGVLHVALASVSVDDDMDPGHGVAVNDVVRDAVEVVAAAEVLAEIRVQPAVTVVRGDVVDDGRGVGRHRGVSDVLVPRVVRGEERIAQEGGHRAVFQRLQQKAPAAGRAAGRGGCGSAQDRGHGEGLRHEWLSAARRLGGVAPWAVLVKGGAKRSNGREGLWYAT